MEVDTDTDAETDTSGYGNGVDIYIDMLISTYNFLPLFASLQMENCQCLNRCLVGNV
jgi:hypothetical protein